MCVCVRACVCVCSLTLTKEKAGPWLKGCIPCPTCCSFSMFKRTSAEMPMVMVMAFSGFG